MRPYGDSNFFIPNKINEKNILLTHDINYYNKLINFELDRERTKSNWFQCLKN